MAEVRLKENESLENALEDLRSSVQELALSLKFVREKLMRSPL